MQRQTEPNTVWLCGDSTMAPGGGHNGTEGWGQYLKYSLDPSALVVNNSAYAGRSARSFTREGRFQAIFDSVRPGDWAVIEFGHNDGRMLLPLCLHQTPFLCVRNLANVVELAGDPANDTKYRVDCPGMGTEICPVVYEYVGSAQVVFKEEETLRA